MVDKRRLMDRLRAEGRWAEAERFKDAALAEFKAKGVKNAADAAWEAMAEKFPPLENIDGLAGEPSPPQQPSGTEPDDGLFDLTEDSEPSNLNDDILWVYRNMSNRRVTPESAPSNGCWGLLLWARKYQIKFYESLLPKALAAGPDVDEEQNQRGERKSIAEIRKILSQFDEPPVTCPKCGHVFKESADTPGGDR